MKRLKVGDEVVVITGRDKSRKGKITRILNTNRVIVQGINLVKKHQKGNPNTGAQGGIVEREASLHISNVQLYNSATGLGDRIGFRKLNDGKKVRYFKSNDEVIDA